MGKLPGLIIAISLGLLGVLLSVRAGFHFMRDSRRHASWPVRQRQIANGRRYFGLAFVLLGLIVGGVVMILNGKTTHPALSSTQTATPESTAPMLPTEAFTNTPSVTSSPAPTETPTLTSTPAQTDTPTLTSSPSPTFTITMIPSWTPTPSFTHWPSWTPSWTPTITQTPSNTFTPSKTATWPPTWTPLPTHTRWPSMTPTITH